MKTLAALSALLAAAFAALLFPAMKNVLLLIPFALLVLACSGCASRLASSLQRMPDGAFQRLVFQETGKFTSTTVTGAGVVKDNGKLTADSLTIEHTDPWFPKISLQVEGYQVQLSAAEKRKPIEPIMHGRPPPAAPSSPSITSSEVAAPTH